MTMLAFSQADAVGWICLVAGLAVLATGCGIGLWLSFQKTSGRTGEAMTKLDEAKASIADAKEKIGHAHDAVTGEGGLEGGGPAVADATAAAGASTDAAASALEQVQGIVGSLPENLRFAGLLVLVGVVLISVATIQFGGTSLF